jgi:hypothetical protein
MKTASAAAFCALALLSVVLVLPGMGKAQLPTPTVEFIPDQVSAESSFVMIGDPGSVGGSIRMTWITDSYGSMPYMNDRYMCYFSDTDFESTCGPSPFRLATTTGFPYQLDIFSFDSEGNQANATKLVDVGGIKIVPQVEIDINTNKALIVVHTTPPSNTLTYRVYDSNFNSVSGNYQNLNKISGTPYYNTSIPLASDEQYVAFKATSDEDFGGGIIKISLTDGSGSGTGGVSGLLTADPVNIDIVYQPGLDPALPQNKRIINSNNQTFTGVTIDVPSPIDQYLSINIPSTYNSTIGPNEAVYYEMSLTSISNSMELKTEAEIKSISGTRLGVIPVDIRVSYIGGGSVDCSTAGEGAECLGGKCCGGICRKGADCCTSTDCTTGQTCSASFECSSGSSSITCFSGSCMTDVITCPSGYEETGTCMQAGIAGVCCAEENECLGQTDGYTCSVGVCYQDECVPCIGDSDCDDDEECLGNFCYEKDDTSGPSEGGDMTLIIIILIAVVVAGGAGAYYYFTKMKKGESAEDEFEKDKDEDEAFSDDEFY